MTLREIGEYVLDFLLPRSALDQRVSTLTVDDLTVAATPKSSESGNVMSLFSYRDALIRHMIWSLKYKKKGRVAALFAEVLREHLLEELSERRSFGSFLEPLLIPIPLSRQRLAERGFNQVELVAQKIENQNLFELRTDILQKIRHTPNQTSLSRQKRLENVKGVFSVMKPEAIPGRDVILLDDVTTTGSTLSEAKNTLLKADAREVLCIALAH